MVAFHRDMKGSLERTRDGRWRLYRASLGFLTKLGGYSSKPAKAAVFNGPGEAIRAAALHGFAVVRWWC